MSFQKHLMVRLAITERRANVQPSRPAVHPPQPDQTMPAANLPAARSTFRKLLDRLPIAKFKQSWGRFVPEQ